MEQLDLMGSMVTAVFFCDGFVLRRGCLERESDHAPSWCVNSPWRAKHVHRAGFRSTVPEGGLVLWSPGSNPEEDSLSVRMHTGNGRAQKVSLSFGKAFASLSRPLSLLCPGIQDLPRGGREGLRGCRCGHSDEHGVFHHVP